MGLSIWRKARHISGITFDWLVKHIVFNLLRPILDIPAQPSQTRWGILAFLFALGFFLLALGAQFGSARNGGGVVVIVLYSLGALFTVIGLCLSGYFLRHPNPEDSAQALERKLMPRIDSLDANMSAMVIELQNIRKVLEQIRDK